MPWCNNWQIFDLILVLGTISLSGNGLQAAFLDAVRTGRRPWSVEDISLSSVGKLPWFDKSVHSQSKVDTIGK